MLYARRGDPWRTSDVGSGFCTPSGLQMESGNDPNIRFRTTVLGFVWPLVITRVDHSAET